MSQPMRFIPSLKERASGTRSPYLSQKPVLHAVVTDVPVETRGRSLDLPFPRTSVCSRVRRQCLTLAFFLLIGSSCLANDDAGVLLSRQFEAAKASLAAQDLPQAEQRYRKTIALGLRQLGNLSLSENHLEQATQLLDDALKLTPEDSGLQVEQAVAWFRRGDSNKAKTMIGNALAGNPGLARAHNVLGRILLFEGNAKEAVKELKTAVGLQDDFETSYFLAIALLKAKEQSEAAELFRKIQASTGESAALHVLFGRAYLVTHFSSPAVTEFKKAIQLDAKYPRAHSLLGYATLEFAGESAYPDARKLFEQELKIQPKDYLTLVLLGIATVSLRDFATAESVLLRAAAIRPDGAAPYLYLGETYTATRRYPAAVKALKKYVSLVHNPEEFHRDLGRGYFLLGQDLLRVGEAEQARKALIRSRQLREAEFKYDQEHMFFDQEHQVEARENQGSESHTSERVAGMLEAGSSEEDRTTQNMAQAGLPSEGAVQRTASPPASESAAAKRYRRFANDILASSYNDLGVMRAQESNFAEAAEFFKRASACKAELAGLDRNWGLAAYRAQLYSEAIPPLKRQLAARPNDDLVRRLLGISYFAENDFSRTVEVLRPFLKNPPDDAALLFSWATALVRTNQAQTGKEIFRLLLEKNAENPSVHFLLGQAYAQQEDYANALRELETSLKLDPQVQEAHYYIGLVHLHESNFQAAAQAFRDELKVRPGDTVTSYHLAFALRSEGQLDEAARILREVVTSKPDYEVAHFELGRALLQQGDATAAVASFETAKKLVPSHEATYFQLSQAYRKVGRIKDANEALATYRRFIEEDRLKKRKSIETE
jgi:tetratricopeptide (TPR) repeat protein